MSENVDYKEIFTEYRVIIETYAFLDKHIEDILINKYVPLLQKGAKIIIFPHVVRRDLEYRISNKLDSNYQDAKNAVTLINMLYEKNECFEEVGDDFDYDLESQLRYVISQKSKNGKIAIITKNARLAKGIWEFVKKREIDGVKILNISSDSELVNWNIEEKLYNPKELVSARCKKCRKFFKISRGIADKVIDSRNDLFCPECRDEFIECECGCCGIKFTISKNKYENITEKGNIVYCPKCKKEKIIYTKCSSCGKNVIINRSKYDNLNDKKISILCSECLIKKLNK